MSASIPFMVQPLSLQASLSQQALLAKMRKQCIEDFFFHKITMAFSLIVLLVLVGIIVLLNIRACPVFHEFGLSFTTRVEWDPVNNQYGAMIAIVGTLVTSFIALLIAFPISFGIALFLTKICSSKLR